MIRKRVQFREMDYCGMAYEAAAPVNVGRAVRFVLFRRIASAMGRAYRFTRFGLQTWVRLKTHLCPPGIHLLCCD
jgi:hypothetical protein